MALVRYSFPKELVKIILHFSGSPKVRGYESLLVLRPTCYVCMFFWRGPLGSSR